MLLLHVYFVLLETVLFGTRGAKVFGVPKDQIEMRAAAMSNLGCYNGFLVAAIALGLFWPDAAIARAFLIYGLVCRRCQHLGRGYGVQEDSLHSGAALCAGAGRVFSDEGLIAIGDARRTMLRHA